MSEIEAEIVRLQRQVAESPRSLAFVRLADTLRQAGRTTEALAVLRRGESERPDYAPARVVLARVHLDLGHTELAIGVLREVVRVDAQNFVAAALLATLLVDAGQLDEVRPMLERLLSHGGEEATRAEALLRRVLGLEAPAQGPDPFDAGTLADRLHARGYTEAARRMWERILTADPDNPVYSRKLAAIQAAPASAPSRPPPGPARPGARRRLQGYLRLFSP